MKFGRGQFLGASAAALAAAVVPVTATAFEKKVGPHEHGLNGVHLPLDKRIDLTLRVLDGPDFRLANAVGDVVFLNFFTTWCPPCLRETPHLTAFAETHPEVTFVGVDVGDSDDAVRAWRKKYQVGYPIGMDRRHILFANIEMNGYPTTLVIRPDGRLSCVFFGGMNARDLESEIAYARDTSRD